MGCGDLWGKRAKQIVFALIIIADIADNFYMSRQWNHNDT